MLTIQLPVIGSQFVLDFDYETEVDDRTVFIPAGTVFTITEQDGLPFEEQFAEYGSIAFGAAAQDVTFHSPNDRSGQSDVTYSTDTLWFDIEPHELELI
jgi:hypothetical protein